MASPRMRRGVRLGACVAFVAGCGSAAEPTLAAPPTATTVDGAHAGAPFALAVVAPTEIVAGGHAALRVVTPDGGPTDVTWRVVAGGGSVDAHHMYTAPIVFGDTAVDLIARSVQHPEVEAKARLRVLGALPAMASQGGATLARPVFTAVTFDGDPLAAPLERFVATIGTSAYWRATTAEYGVAPATATSPTRLDEKATAFLRDDDVKAWLTQKLERAVLPPPVDGSVYVLFYPTGTTIDLAQNRSCYSFLGYHGEAKVGGKSVVYAVLPRCGDDRDALTRTVAHELVEAATDPFVDSAPAIVGVDPRHAAWSLAMSSEVADLCLGHASDVSVGRTADFPFMTQRSWSSAAAASGHDPCVPSNDTFFAGFPVLEDDVDAIASGRSVRTKGVKIPLGATRTIDVVAYSDGPSSEIADFSFSPFFDADGAPYLDGTLEPHTAKSGTRMKLTLTARRADPQIGGSVFFVTSMQKSGATRSIPGFVAIR